MKRIIIIFLASLTLINFASAKKEIINFNLKFGIIKGGEAQFIISDTTFNGKPAIYYYMSGRTTGLTDKLFGVRDAYETIVDAETRLPLKVVRNVREGKYRKYNETLFYHEIDSAYSQNSGWLKVPDNVIDILTVFFYFTNKYPLENVVPGYSVTFPSYNEEKVSKVTIVYGGQEKLNTDLGKMLCYILNPITDKGKLLNSSDGMKFYISKESKIPVQMEFDMRVGSLRAVLKSYTVDGVRQKYS